jgi:hypothetical protein
MLRGCGVLYIAAVIKPNFLPPFFTAELKRLIIIISIMTLLESILAITISLVTIITSVALGVRWLTKHYFDEIKHEMKPNSGTSIKDQVTRLESRTENLEHKIDKIYDLLVEEGIKTKSRRAKSTEL